MRIGFLCSMGVKVKKGMTVFFSLWQDTHILKHIYKKQFTKLFSCSTQVLIPFGAAGTIQPVRHAGTYNSVRLINLVVVFPLQSRQHQNIVWMCSQGQEGKLLAASQTKVSDGMCCTSYLISENMEERQLTLPRDQRATSGHRSENNTSRPI